MSATSPSVKSAFDWKSSGSVPCVWNAEPPAWRNFRGRTDGRQRSHTLAHGLQVTIRTADGEFIAISRKEGPPDMTEAQVVARDAGWTWFSADWQTIAGRRYIVIRPETPTGEPEPEPEDLDPPSPEIIALLTDPDAPWHHKTFSA